MLKYIYIYTNYNMDLNVISLRLKLPSNLWSVYRRA